MTATIPAPAPALVIVLGSINMDLVVRVPRFLRPGETLAGSDFLTVGGGKGANQATAAARMGATVRFVGAVGDDDFGARRLADMAADGIDVAAVRRLPEHATGVALITVDAAGENIIVLAAGANAAVSPADISAYDFAGAQGGVCVAQLELPLGTVTAGLRAARAAGLTTLLNVAPYDPAAATLLPDVDILVANAGEASDLAGWHGAMDMQGAMAVASRLGEQGPGIVAITLGAAGVVVVTANGTVYLPAPAVRVVDSTGAGDCFVGVFAAGLAGGMTTAAAATRAIAAASYSVTVRGATPGMPTAAQLAVFQV